MKTFSLRLTEIEALALERMARVNGVSKNKQIQQLIAEAYSKLDTNCDTLLGELYTIDGTEDSFLTSMKEELYNGDDHSETATEAKAARVLRQIDYLKEQTNDEKIIDILEAQKTAIFEYLQEGRLPED